jgi:hypothetical protein
MTGLAKLTCPRGQLAHPSQIFRDKGSLAMFAAMRRASSRVIKLAADRLALP